jgi:hypothetical protein
MQKKRLRRSVPQALLALSQTTTYGKQAISERISQLAGSSQIPCRTKGCAEAVLKLFWL